VKTRTVIIVSVSLVLISLFFTSGLFTKKSSPFLSSLSSLRSPPSVLPSQLAVPPLTLDSIFNSDHSWINQLPQGQTITLITTGDIIPARTVNYKMTLYNDFTHPFKKTADFLSAADLTLINLEAPLIKNCPVTNEGMIFCGNQRFLDGLLFAGIDVVNLANNHTLNWGIEEVKQTIDLLKQNNIASCGFPVKQMAIEEIKGIKIGFLGWNLLETFNPDEILETIQKAKKEVDLLIISVHWGAEYTAYPADWQRELAQQMIENGADLIVGNHPHWIQPLEIYQDRLIIYAHGNFIFDQEWSLETKTGYVTKIAFYQGKIVDVQLFPVFISDYNQPEFLTEEKKEFILQKLKGLSFSLIKQKASQ
jgi:poly-gamma-glutamate capsule biosynthesis protein CapA/YwtB (metallophosphatase superfamily)